MALGGGVELGDFSPAAFSRLASLSLMASLSLAISCESCSILSCCALSSTLIASSSLGTEEVPLVFLSWATRNEKGAKNMINEINVRFASIDHLSTTSKRSAQPGKRRRLAFGVWRLALGAWRLAVGGPKGQGSLAQACMKPNLSRPRCEKVF